MSPRRVDLHVHVFPDFVHEHIPSMIPVEKVDFLRDQARRWFKPISIALHKAQPGLRFLPHALRTGIDEVASIAPLPSLLIESTREDLESVMDQAGLTHAVAVAQPPVIGNDLVLSLARDNPRFLAAVNIPLGTVRPGIALKKLHNRGAKLLKVHPAFDGEGVRSNRYQALLKMAAELAMPVIIHTGRLHASLFYRDPTLSEASLFSPWFKDYPTIPFILNQMNFHEPSVAIDLAEDYPNVHLDTAWQPAEVIGEAVRRLGPERILFASDWPFGGNNISIGIRKIEDCVDAGTLNESDAELILGENAAKLLRIN